MKTKLLLIAEIEHPDPRPEQTARGLAEHALDAYREAVRASGQFWGVTLYQPPDPRVLLIGTFVNGFEAVGPFEDGEHVDKAVSATSADELAIPLALVPPDRYFGDLE